jgi:aspartate/glutamate racemase
MHIGIVACSSEAAALCYRAICGRTAVILGCTEIPLIMNDDNPPLPTLDSTRPLARTALRRALSK